VQVAKQFFQHYFQITDGNMVYESHNLPFLPINKSIVIVNMGSSIQERMIGLDRSIEEDDGSFAPSFLGTKNNCPTFTLQLACVDKKTGQTETLTADEMFELMGLLFKDYYRPFKVYGLDYNKENSSERELTFSDMFYYVIFTRGKQFNYSNGKGYLELEMRLDSPCAYSQQIEATATINESGSISVQTKFNVGEYIYPDIEFVLNYSGRVIITNETTGQTMTFTSVPANHKIYCYNEGYKYVQDKSDETAYAMGMLEPNSVWLALKNGKNNIKVTTENGKRVVVRIIYQNKIAIQ
jgi:hypothetical protein